MKDKIIFSTKFLGFLVIYFVVMIILDIIFPSDIEVEISTAVISALFGQILVNSTAIVYLINRLQMKGAKLIITTALIVYGMQIFMTQMETWIFIEAFPMISKNEIVKLFIGGLILSLLVTTIAFFIWRRKHVQMLTSNYKNLISSWIWKIPVLSVVYMILYVVFGTFIAWRSEELRDFYSTSVVNIDFFELRIIQIFRGGLWILLCIPIIIWLKGKRIEKIIVTSLLLAILPTILLLFPNPYMPEGVRLTHFVEIFLSNGLFGIILSYLLTMQNIKPVPNNV